MVMDIDPPHGAPEPIVLSEKQSLQKAGFLREFLEQRVCKVVEDVLHQHEDEPDCAEADRVLMRFRNAPSKDKQRILKEVQKMGPEAATGEPVIPAKDRFGVDYHRSGFHRDGGLVLLRPARHDAAIRCAPTC